LKARNDSASFAGCSYAASIKGDQQIVVGVIFRNRLPPVFFS